MACMGNSFSFYYGSKTLLLFTKFLDKSRGDYFWVKDFISQQQLLRFGALCNLTAKMHNTSKFKSIKFMDANFFNYSTLL